VQAELIQEIDASFRVYDQGSFRTARFFEYLNRENIPWPLLDSGALKLDRDTFAAMMDAYKSGDPYLMFARQAGAVPEDATKASHPHEQAQFKACVLATQYGQGPESFGLSLPCDPS
jgi:hypothetical protein